MITKARANMIMAKVLFTAVVADMRNKLNGSVFSKNRGGSYVRTKVTPVNPQTDAQQSVRGRFGAFAAAWRGLTEAERQSWIDAAPSFPVTDIFGSSKILSGSQLYSKLNLNLAQAGQTEITTAPTPADIPSLIGLSLSATDTPGLTFDADLQDVPAGFSAVVFATPNYGAGISFVKNKFRFITALAAAAAMDPANILAAYQAVFGNPIAGQKISIRVFLVSNTTGQAGVPFSATAIVTT